MNTQKTEPRLPEKSAIGTALRWWLPAIVCVLPWWLTITYLTPATQNATLSLVLFIAGLCSLFLHLKLFNRFKHAVIAAGRNPSDASLWQAFLTIRQRGLWGAVIPSLLAVPAWLIGLETVASALLVIASLMLLWLYRVPRQLWR